MRRAASRGLRRRERTRPPSTTTMDWREDPPRGVRRQPARPSNRTSARWVGRPCSMRVLRKTAPTARPAAAAGRPGERRRGGGAGGGGGGAPPGRVGGARGGGGGGGGGEGAGLKRTVA